MTAGAHPSAVHIVKAYEEDIRGGCVLSIKRSEKASLPKKNRKKPWKNKINVHAKEFSTHVFQVHWLRVDFGQIVWGRSRRSRWDVRSCLSQFARLLSVELIGYEIFQLLSQVSEAGPYHCVQSPALLHDVIHHWRAAVRGVHFITLFYTWNHVLQRL